VHNDEQFVCCVSLRHRTQLPGFEFERHLGSLRGIALMGHKQQGPAALANFAFLRKT
jgi:hypothetical protein